MVGSYWVCHLKKTFWVGGCDGIGGLAYLLFCAAYWSRQPRVFRRLIRSCYMYFALTFSIDVVFTPDLINPIQSMQILNHRISWNSHPKCNHTTLNDHWKCFNGIIWNIAPRSQLSAQAVLPFWITVKDMAMYHILFCVLCDFCCCTI